MKNKAKIRESRVQKSKILVFYRCAYISGGVVLPQGVQGVVLDSRPIPLTTQTAEAESVSADWKTSNPVRKRTNSGARCEAPNWGVESYKPVGRGITGYARSVQ